MEIDSSIYGGNSNVSNISLKKILNNFSVSSESSSPYLLFLIKILNIKCLEDKMNEDEEKFKEIILKNEEEEEDIYYRYGCKLIGNYSSIFLKIRDIEESSEEEVKELIVKELINDENNKNKILELTNELNIIKNPLIQEIIDKIKNRRIEKINEYFGFYSIDKKYISDFLGELLDKTEKARSFEEKNAILFNVSERVFDVNNRSIDELINKIFLSKLQMRENYIDEDEIDSDRDSNRDDDIGRFFEKEIVDKLLIFDCQNNLIKNLINNQ